MTHWKESDAALHSEQEMHARVTELKESTRHSAHPPLGRASQLQLSKQDKKCGVVIQQIHITEKFPRSRLHLRTGIG